MKLAIFTLLGVYKHHASSGLSSLHFVVDILGDFQRVGETTLSLLGFGLV